MSLPYDMMLLVKDTVKRHIFELSDSEIEAVAEGWADSTSAIHKIMPQIGRVIVYNIVTHNGLGAGLYIEFLPYTQEIGGIEQLGLIVCQENPYRAVLHLRESMAGDKISLDASYLSITKSPANHRTAHPCDYSEAKQGAL